MRASISSIKLFKACRRAYQLKYIEHLVPIKRAEALETGTNYHAKLEQLYKTGDFDKDLTKETAMALAYKRWIYPMLLFVVPEERFEYYLGQHELVGITDGIASDGCIIEHKTTSLMSLDEYEYNLQWDEQLMAYMLATGARKVYYTVCRKPNIRQKASETDEEFFERMCDWYYTETDDKIRLFEITKTDAEIEDFRKSLNEVMTEMEYTVAYYKNTCHCHSWGRQCEYASICLSYKPGDACAEYETWEADR
mgnify:CR=1 FL=1